MTSPSESRPATTGGQPGNSPATQPGNSPAAGRGHGVGAGVGEPGGGADGRFPGWVSARHRTGWGVATGLITAAVALGVGQFVAGITGPQGAPVVAVGNAAIDLTPPPVKDFAISAFGSSDKAVLVGGIVVVLAACAAVIGAVAVRRLRYGLTGLVAFALIGVAAALTRPAAPAAGALPTVIGAVAGALVMVWLVRLTSSTAAGPASLAGSAAAAPGPAGQQPAGSAGTPAGGDAPVPPAALPPGPSFPRADRRRFLITGTAAVAAAGVGAFAGRTLTERTGVSHARSALRIPAAAQPAPPLPPGADLDIPGLSPFITPNGVFYRVDTALILPQVSPRTWQLRIHGMVEREITLSLDDLLRLPLIENYTTLTCVSNPVGGSYAGNARWLGASLASLLRRAGIRSGATQLLCTSVDGFTSGTPVQVVMDGRDALLAVAMNGSPLPVAHGFPVRMVVPGLYGYVSATKWITDIKVTTFAERAYWVQRGWVQRAPVKTESRIGVPSGSTPLRAGRTPVAGVAWAQHKGIDAVHVRVDGGPWRQARLAAVPGIDTWRQWVWEWEATPGSHQIEARATDASGYTQTGVQTPPEPSGATGYPSVTVTVR